MGNCLLACCAQFFRRGTSSPKASANDHGQSDHSTEGLSSSAAPLRHQEDGSLVLLPPNSGVSPVGREDVRQDRSPMASSKLPKPSASPPKSHALPQVPS
uniref:Uncharacterized protein n=1 Tax=Arundo donax TaxID=35708 RepID=A0A0A9PXE7_ARUDO